jgi:hypothetical protein
MSDDLQTEVDRLISIAHWHAAKALARPPSQWDSHLAVCRGFWKHYAEAFTADEGQRESFVDALERATRDLMAEMQKNAAVIQQAGGVRITDDAARPHPGKPTALTLDELRPIFRQIIEQ